MFNLDFQRKTHYKFINEAIEIYNCKKLDFPDQEAVSMAKSKSLKLDFSYNMGYFDEEILFQSFQAEYENQTR